MINLSGIKNIIFDFGGVIINIDFNLTYKHFQNFGVTNLDSKFSKAKQTKIFDLFEKGLISETQFRKNAKSLLNINISDQEFDKAWNAMILDIPAERISLIKKLAQKYRLFLLSNSNTIHYNLYKTNLKKIYGFEDFNDLFEKAFFSFQIGMIKPDNKIFNFVLKQHHLNTDETIFIDDSIQHIIAAQKIGLKTYLIEDKEITDIF